MCTAFEETNIEATLAVMCRVHNCEERNTCLPPMLKYANNVYDREES